ncbi:MULTISPECIES: flagellar hook-basal body complex protein FliE [unclassified Endozoicomonas]|uniref:flagellar hook-basal body complex protein FliE n=1 Tax=unclassified Endozoicomonas TaxID=2644528 RepID=UPI0021487D63|nr:MULTISPECIES: flagellar hook-basal body complex protein FliE [unclassified Endozoicomonas]
MDIKGLNPDSLSVLLKNRPAPILPSSVASEGMTTNGFGNLLQQAIEKVNDLQQESSGMMHKIETGESDDLMGTMIAMQKSSISFQALMQVRNKAVTAYEDIMRMQI